MRGTNWVFIQECIKKFQDSTCKKDVCLPWMLNSSITFKVLPLCTNTAVPAFLPCLEASLEVPFWNCVKYPPRFLSNLFNGVESFFDSSSEASSWGRGERHRGPDRVSMGMGDHCHVVLGQKLRNFKGPLSRRFVVVLVLSFLWPLAPHIFT